MNFFERILLLLAALALPAFPLHSATISWTNVNGGNWNVAANWNPNILPGAADTAIISEAGNYTVTLNVSPTIAGLVVGGGATGIQTLSQPSAINLTLNGSGTIHTNGRYNLGAGTLGGANTVELAGAIAWSGGALASTAAISVSPEGALDLSGTAIKVLSGAVTNAGTTRWSGTGILRGAGGRLHNLAGGLFEIQNDQLMDWYSGTPQLVNEGTIRKIAGTGTSTLEVPLVNTGTIEARTGVISFGGGSVFNSGTEFRGGGINRCANGTVTFTGDILSENLELNGAVVDGTSTFFGTNRWLSGTFSINSAPTIAPMATLLIGGISLKYNGGRLTNAGTIRWSGTGDLRGIGGKVHNLAGGIFELQGDQFLDSYTGTPVFINEDIIRKTADTGIATLDFPLTNSGTIEALTGAISFGDGSRFTSGTQFLGAGTNLCASGTVTFSGDISSENLELNGALIDGTSTFFGTTRWLSGTFSVNSAPTIAPTATLLIGGAVLKYNSGQMTNAGTIRWSGAGAWRGAGGKVYNLAGGLFELQGDQFLDIYSGTPEFVNQGIIRKTAGTGISTLEFPLINSGTLEAQTGVISLGDGSVLTGGTRFIGTGINRCSSGTVTFSGDIFSENLELNGAIIAGTNTFSGVVRWLSGTFSGGALVAPAATLLMDGIGLKTLNGVLTNAGAMLWRGSGIGAAADFRLVGRVHNLLDGLFEIQNDELLDFYAGAPQFINDGVIRKTAGPGTTTWQVPLINSGTVEVQVGVISLPGGSVFNTGTRLIGPGVAVLNSGTITLNGDIYSQNLQLNGATITGSGSFNGSLDWLSGTLQAALNLTIPTDGILRLRSAGLKTINGSVTNAGTILWEGTGDLRLIGSVHNLPSGLFEARNNELLDLYTGSPEFVNEGVFRKINSTGTTTVQVRMLNSGIIETATGTLILPGGSVFSTGTRLLGTGVTMLNAGTITLDGEIHSDNLQLNGATITGSDSFNGSLDWLSGTLQAALNLTIPPNGLLRLRSTGLKTINGSVTNAGTILWEGTGDLRLIGSLHNLPLGLFEARNNELLDFYSGTPEFVNEGTFRKTNSTGTTTVEVRMLNSGTIDVATGTLLLPGGSVFSTGTRFLGAGVTALNSGTVTLDGAIYSDNLQLNGATITGSAGSFTGSLDWLNGTLQAALDLTIPTNGTLRLRSTGLKIIHGAVANSGTILWERTGDLRLVGSLHNLPSGLFEARNDELLDFYSGTPILINEGIFRKAADTNITTSQIRLQNFGSLQVNSGTLFLQGGISNYAGQVILGGGRLQLPSSATLNLRGGSLEGFGTLLAHLFNDNLVFPAGSNGVLTISGNYTQAVTATLAVELGGLSAGTNHSHLRVTGRANLDGTLETRLAPGFLPAMGDSFDIASWPNNVGTFKCYNGLLLLGTGSRLVPEYHPTNVTLVTVAATEPQPNRLAVHRLANNELLICWPSEFLGHTLQSATNLVAPIWTDLTTIPRCRTPDHSRPASPWLVPTCR